MKKNINYYRMTLYNPFEECGLKQDAILVANNGEGRELLTNKKVFLYDDSLNCLEPKYILSLFTNQKCELIGSDFEELDEEFVLKFLKFTPRKDIENMVNNIEKIEKSLKNCLNKNNTKKYEFLKKY